MKKPKAPPFKVDGKEFQSARELADWADVPYATITYRLRNDWPPEKAAKTPVRQLNRRPTQISEVDGMKFKTAKELSDWSGVPYATLTYRLNRGWSPKEAAKKTSQGDTKGELGSLWH